MEKIRAGAPVDASRGESETGRARPRSLRSAPVRSSLESRLTGIRNQTWVWISVAAGVLFFIGLLASTLGPSGSPTDPLLEAHRPKVEKIRERSTPPETKSLVAPEKPPPDRQPDQPRRASDPSSDPVEKPERPVPPADLRPEKSGPSDPATPKTEESVPASRTTTVAALLMLEKAEGSVFILRGADQKNRTSPVAAGQGISGGEGIATGQDSWAVLRYPDETQVVVEGDAIVRFPLPKSGTPAVPEGKSIVIDRGGVSAQVAKQPKGRPMTLITPHAQATVQGTRLALKIVPGSTLLEVTEGLVRLTRSLDNASVDVKAGKFAVAGEGIELVALTIPRGGAPSPGAPAALGLIGHWRFDEGMGTLARDSSGKGHTAAISGAVWTEGKWGGALRFDGKSSSVELPSSPVLDKLQEGSYTLSAWFKPEGTPSGKEGTKDLHYAVIMKTGRNEGIQYMENGHFIFFHFLADGTPYAAETSQKAFPPGTFYHVAGAVNRTSGNVELYVNGALEGSSSWTPDTPGFNYGTMTWKVGCASPSGIENRLCARGVIDEVRLYNRALEATEIEALSKARP